MPKGAIPNLDPTRAPSVFDIDVLRVARVYAEALLNAAEKADKVDLVWDQFAALTRGAGPGDPSALLTSPAIPPSRLGEVIQTAFAGKVDALVLNFLMVLHEHQRMSMLRAVATVMHELMDERARRVQVRVSSAVPLTDPERAQVKDLAQRRFDMEPILIEAVDPTLLGGVRIQVGDQVIDATVRTRLESLKNQLLARSSHAIRR